MASLIKQFIWFVLVFFSLLFFAWPAVFLVIIGWFCAQFNGEIGKIEPRLDYWRPFEQ